VKSRDGFTVIELLVVITIMGLAAAMVPALSGGLIERVRLSLGVQRAVVLLHTAETLAKEQRAPVAIDQARLASVAQANVQIRNAANGDTVAALWFYSDGTASPADITISLPPRWRRLTVDGLTGSIVSNGQ
jgi:prepilin-type N-terminal cleavage/methylation domain-containing protein